MSKPYTPEPERAMRAPEPFIPDERLGRTRDEIEREIARREIARIREEYFAGRNLNSQGERCQS